MSYGSGEQRLYRLFAELLDYPRTDLAETVRECQALAALRNPEAAALLDEFRSLAETKSVSRLQEIYSVTFDLDASCHPYVGYYLFGETYKRSAFLLGLKERFQAQGFAAPENELPDHLVVLLQFMAVCNDRDIVVELVQEALLPALARMVKESDGAESPDENAEEPDRHRSSRSPYQGVLQALQLVLQSLSTNDQYLVTASGRWPTATTAVVAGGLP